jgi:site-specific DNA recombinase
MMFVQGIPMRVGIYARVSTQGQSSEDRFSLGTQEGEARQYCEREGHRLIGEFVGAGGGQWPQTHPRATGLARLLDAMDADKLDAVVCHDPDRLSRSQAVLGVILDRVDQINRKRGLTTTRLRFVTGDFDLGATGTFILQARIFAAELQRERIMEGSSRGKRGKVASGKPLGAGMPPYGLRYTDGKRRFEADPATIGWLRWMFDQADAGKSLRGIGQELQRLGIPPPYHCRTGSMRWGETSVRRILGNEQYIGIGAAFETTWEPVPGLTREW